MTAELAAEWLALLRRLGGRGDHVEEGSRLLAAYGEPHRAYHNAGHLEDVLHHVTTLAPYALDADAVRLAAWFHDAVYDPLSADNEDRSAMWAEQALPALHLAPPLVAEVVRLVRLTASHDPEPGDANGAVLCDADLAVLASPPERYDAYVGQVRQEYRHVPEPAFRAARAQILRALVARPLLFHTPLARDAWEEAARANVERELSR